MEEIKLIEKRKLLNSFLEFYEGTGEYLPAKSNKLIEDYFDSINN